VVLPSYIPGTVSAIEGGTAVTISCRASLVQGIFGVGGERHGKLKILDVPPSTILRAEHIPENVAGCVLVGGTCPDYAALRKVIERGAAGLFTGSIKDQPLHELLGYELGLALTGDEDIPITLILSEGFGSLSLAPRILDLLKPLDGREVSLHGATQVRAGAVRPELIVPLEADAAKDTAEVRAPSLETGRKVRIIRAPYFGEEATVSELPTGSEELESGVRTRVLKATLSGGKVVTLPRANVELLD
jgi:hypothetical protein